MPRYKGPLGTPTDVITARDRYATLRSALWSERSTFDQHWKELGDFLMPRRTRFWAGDRNRGDKRNQNIIDSTGRFAARTLSSGLHAGLTSPARPWMKLTTHNPALAKVPAIKKWLYEVTERMLAIFATSNLYNVLPLVYLDMGIFGTSSMSVVQDDDDVFRCYSYPIGSYVLGQDKRGKTATFLREYQLSVEQVVEEFAVSPDGRSINWEPISRWVRTEWERGNYQAPVLVTWVVMQNHDYDRSRLDGKFKKFASCYFETATDEKTLLRESGFDTFPIMAPRWDITGEDTYGTDCPGMTCLGDVKQLQIMQKRKGQLLAKAVDPPLMGPSSLRTQKTSLIPGDITYVDVRDGQKGLGPIHEVRLEGFQHLSADIVQVQGRVQRSFYEDLFLMIAQSDEQRGAQPMTAREVNERHEEKLLALGPVLERTNDELLDPVVDRVYHLMDAAGLIPEAPPQLRGVNLKVEYISILAEAQKLVGVIGQDRFLQSTGALAQLWPEAIHKIDPFAVVNSYGDMLGVDPTIIVSDDDARRTLNEARQQQQAAAQAAQAGQVAKAAKDASQAPLTGDSVLARLVAAGGSGVPPAQVGQPPATPAGQ